MLDDPKSQTRFYLRKAFYECLAQNAPLTITRLCDQAGVGRRTFYRHYDGLDGVFADCLEQLLTRYRDAVSPLRTYDLEQIATEFFSFGNSRKKSFCCCAATTRKSSTMACFRVASGSSRPARTTASPCFRRIRPAAFSPC